jgi:hypothetical protein
MAFIGSRRKLSFPRSGGRLAVHPIEGMLTISLRDAGFAARHPGVDEERAFHEPVTRGGS